MLTEDQGQACPGQLAEAAVLDPPLPSAAGVAGHAPPASDPIPQLTSLWCLRFSLCRCVCLQRIGTAFSSVSRWRSSGPSVARDFCRA